MHFSLAVFGVKVRDVIIAMVSHALLLLLSYKNLDILPLSFISEGVYLEVRHVESYQNGVLTEREQVAIKVFLTKKYSLLTLRFHTFTTFNDP